MKLLNQIKVVKSIVSYYISGKLTPLSVVLLITDKCNSRCKYCETWNRNQKEMQTKQVFKLIDELADIGTQKFSIFGGEPLLRKDIGIIINYAIKRGLYVSIGTNGFLLDKKIDDILNVDLLSISLDGPKEVHDLHRVKGAYDLVIKGIKVARKKDIKIITQTVISKHNVNKLHHILDMADKYKFKAGFQPAMKRPLSHDVDDLIPDKQEFKNVINWLIEQKEKGRRVANSTAGLKHLYHIYDWPKKKKIIKCFAPEFHVYIDPNGDLYPCIHIIDKVKGPANCIKLGFKSAYNKLKKYPCYGCWSWSNVEFNLLYSLNLEVIKNAFKLMNK